MAIRKRSMGARKRRGGIRKTKKSRRRRQRRSKGKVTIRSLGRDIPDRLIVKLSYCDVMTWTLTAGVLNNPLILSTSLYNPRVLPSGGHQPYWYDQWTPNIYTRYRVYGIKYHVTVVNHGMNESWYAGVRPQKDMNVETNLQTLMERKDSKVLMGGSVNSNAKVVLKGYMSTAKALGCAPSEIKNEEWFAADYNTNPIKQANLFFYASHNYASTFQFDATVRCTYYCELFGRATPAAS